MEFPVCTCGRGKLVPLSSGDLTYRGWVCTHPDCGYFIGVPMDYVKGNTKKQPGSDGSIAAFTFGG